MLLPSDKFTINAFNVKCDSKDGVSRQKNLDWHTAGCIFFPMPNKTGKKSPKT